MKQLTKKLILMSCSISMLKRHLKFRHGLSFFRAAFRFGLILSPILSVIELSSQSYDPAKYELSTQKEISTYSKNGQILRRQDDVLVSSYDLYRDCKGTSTLEKAQNFLHEEYTQLGFESFDNSILRYEDESKIQSGTIIKFSQFHKGLRVDDNKITLKFNQAGKLRFVSNSTFPVENNFDVNFNISSQQAFSSVIKYFDNLPLKSRPGKLMIHLVNGVPKLCWQFLFGIHNPFSSWVCYIDAKDGTIINATNITCSVNGTGNVFSPAPTYSARIGYGTGNFVDGDDATNADLEAEMINVVLNEIEENQGVYKLNGPYAQIVDPNGDFDRNSSDFNVTRDDDFFEAVMCYYYIDKTCRYLKDNFGIELDLPYAGGLKFIPNVELDPSAYYDTNEKDLHFGLGGLTEEDVDAAEDAVVILHEFGHALHHSVTGTFALPQGTQGISEGLGDYWAASETRDCSNADFFNEWDEEYHKLFHWGVQPFIDINNAQRTTNYNAPYDYDAYYEIHEGGQFLSTALMKIYSDLGKYKTDLLLTETMAMLNASWIKLQDAGIYLYYTAIDLNFSENDLCIIYRHLDDVLDIEAENTILEEPTGENSNYYIKDTQCDNGTEVNPTLEPLWVSEDIWVRNEEDGILEHQNPEYKMNSPNWVYVRVRGLGCKDLEDAELRVYFTKASTGVVWPNHWNDYEIIGPNGLVLAGDEITDTPIELPIIAPGDEYIISFPWYPPNPADFYTDQHHFCLYARIISQDDPMYNSEGSNVFYNTKNNNNIAWKNISIFDVNPNDISGPISVFLGCNADIQLGSIGISTPNNSLVKKIHELGNVYIELKNPFKSRWINNGSKGDNFTITNEGYLLVENEDFLLDEIEVEDCDEYINIYFEPFNERRFSAFDIIQYDSLNNVIGGERFEYRPEEISSRSIFDKNAGFSDSNSLLIYPNPTSDQLKIRIFNNYNSVDHITVYDIYGRTISTLPVKEIMYPSNNYTLDVSTLNSGVYFLLAQTIDNVAVISSKFIKQ